MRRILFVVLLLAAVACKQRDADDAGLLSDGAPVPASEPAAPAGANVTLACVPADPALQGELFVLAVRGASATDEAQPLAVSVERRHANRAQQADKLADAESGRGAVRLEGPVFVGFPSGVLTADYAGPAAARSHAGLLTLAADPAVNGLAVTCAVQPE